MDIDIRNPKIDRKDLNRKPQNIVLKYPTKTKKGKTERERQDQPENNKQFRVDEQFDPAKIILEL